MKYLCITGASSGIGEKTAALFLAQGWTVFNLSRQASPVAGIINYQVDLGKPRWEESVLPSIIKQIARAEQLCLVHNAARYESDSIPTLKADAFRETLEVNLVAPAILNRALIPYMPRGSSILYLGSTLSEKAVPGAASYVITKHALAGMMRATCQDLLGSHIHTACICPGFTDTQMLRTHLEHDEQKIKAIAQHMGYQRLINPQEIADLIWYCANNAVINGAILHANFGQLES